MSRGSGKERMKANITVQGGGKKQKYVIKEASGKPARDKKGRREGSFLLKGKRFPTTQKEWP